MNRLFLKFRNTRVPAVLLVLIGISGIPAPLARAGSVTGTVTNGTTGKPATGAEVILIQLQGGMQPVANTKTDASGHYSFENAGLGAG
ncbi:MAG TPA: carboxypeptidase regulatory-like domain-containing protein, partial [Candidatus Acidoferrales bacterium]